MTPTTTAWTDDLVALDACREAVAWAQGYDSLAAAWAACERADWMLWLLGRVAGPPDSEARKPLVRCACACARTALRYVPAGEDRPLRAIETAERWARGEATIAEVREARRGAYAYAAYAYADAYAAYAYAAAAYAAYAAAAAAAAAYAGAVAVAVADAAADADARRSSLTAMADIVRAHYPEPPAMGR